MPKRIPPRLLILLIIISSSFSFITNNKFAVRSLDNDEIEHFNPVYSRRHEVTLRVKHNTHENSVLGSWNASQLGYFSDRRVINLDGLINHISYYQKAIISENKYTGTEFLDFFREMNYLT